MNKLSYYEESPFREAIRRPSDGRRRKSNYHKSRGVDLHDIIKRIIENNIGMSFDIAFSYFCKQVPKYQQEFFFEWFDNGIQHKYRKYFLKDGIICKKESRKNRIYKIYSDDYRVFWEDVKRKHKKYTRPYFLGEDYVEKYEGTITIVENTKDKRWKKYVREQNQKYKKLHKKTKQGKQRRSVLIFNEGLRLQKEKELKQKELDLLKRDQHGFDETSFVGHPYHGRQNKNKV